MIQALVDGVRALANRMGSRLWRADIVLAGILLISGSPALAVLEDKDSALYSNASQTVFTTEEAIDVSTDWYRDFASPVQMVLREDKAGTLEVRSHTVSEWTQITLTLPGGQTLAGNPCKVSRVCRVFYIGAGAFSSGSALLTVNLGAQPRPNDYHAVRLSYYEDAPLPGIAAHLKAAENTAFRQSVEATRLKLKGNIANINSSVTQLLRAITIADAVAGVMTSPKPSVPPVPVPDMPKIVSALETGTEVALDFRDTQRAAISGAAVEIGNSLLYLAAGNPVPAYQSTVESFAKVGVLITGIWHLAGVESDIRAHYIAELLVRRNLNDLTLELEKTDADLKLAAETHILPGLLSSWNCSFLSNIFTSCNFNRTDIQNEFLRAYKSHRTLVINEAVKFSLGNFYTDVDQDGIPNLSDTDPNNSDNGEGTVMDNRTGLTWMRCAMGMTWTGTTCTGTPAAYTWDQAVALTANFAGKGDWRLPSIAELNGIVDVKNINPAINSTIFPNTPASSFWSASAYASSSSSAWHVHFSHGDAYNGYKYSTFLVRLVRGGQSFDPLALYTPTTDFDDHNNGTVTHRKTGLMWKRCAEGQTWSGSSCSGSAAEYDWNTAAALASGSVGFTDWRLPTRNELLTIVEHQAFFPAINTTIFPNMFAPVFWSASAGAGSSSNAWGVYFGEGNAFDIYGRSNAYQVRLVRAGQSFGPFALMATKTGIGSGTIASTPAGIDCGATCTSARFSVDATVTLTARPASGSTFTGWSGACKGTGSCIVSMNAPQVVNADFMTLIIGAPNPPTNVTATAGNAQATVNFTAPASGTPINRYTATASPGGRTATVWAAAATPITVTGLTNGTAYTFTVTATNSIGTSAASAPSTPVTPKVGQTIGTITFAPNTLKAGGATTASATATSGLAVSFASTTPAKCTATGASGKTITGIAAGTCTITASQAGNASYSAAPQVAQNITVGAANAPAVSLNRTVLIFAARRPGTASPAQTVTLTNTGSAALNITRKVISGNFAATTTCGTTLAAGANCTFSITFTPAAMGAQTGYVHITSNAAGSTHSIALTGTGKGTRYDFNGDGKSDILWRNTTTGANQIWFMNGGLKSSFANTTAAAAPWAIAGVDDFNGDGKADLLWRHPTTRQTVIWLMNGITRLSSTTISPAVVAPWAAAWNIAGTGDFNGDGKADILWRSNLATGLTAGANQIWLMNGAARTSAANTTAAAAALAVAGVADFNGDGKTDILWRNAATGQDAVWLMNGAAAIAGSGATGTLAAPWTIAGTGDFNADGKSDILWRNPATGLDSIWFMNGAAATGAVTTTMLPTWSVAGVADFNGDGKADITWRSPATGATQLWLMNGAVRSAAATLTPLMLPPWSVAK